MTTISRFEDIQGWQRARELTNFVYMITQQEVFTRDYGLNNQIRRAAVSIMSNIAEGFGRDSNRDLIHFLSIAKASANEVQSQLYVALDQNYISPEQFNQGYQLCDETIRTIGGFIAYLKKSPFKGSKFK
jgi:four helix bundle protein